MDSENINKILVSQIEHYWKLSGFETLPEYAKFKIEVISENIKIKLFKMTGNELNENGIRTIDNEVSFLIKNTVFNKSLAKGLSTEESKELGQQVKTYHD